MESRRQIWKRLLNEIVENGHDHHKDDSPIREIIGVHEFIPNLFIDAAYPIPLNYETSIDWIFKGFADIQEYPMKGEALADYVSSITNEYSIDGGGFIYTYPERLQNMTYNGESYNQLTIIRDRLTYNKGSNRGVACLYSADKDHNKQDIPCLNWLQFLIRKDEYTGRDNLFLSVMFRSNDCYGAWPSNMLFLNCLGIYMADLLRDEYPRIFFEGIDYHCSSLHIYKTDMDAVQKILDGGIPL